MCSTSSRGAALLRATAALLLVAESARAAELTLRMSLRLSAGYNDNVRLVATPHPSVTITSIAPTAEITARTETVTAAAKAQASVNRYSGDSDLDATDLALDASLSKLYERSETKLRAQYVRDSTLASELSQTGVVQANRQRTRVGVIPSWTSRLSERASVEVSYEYEEVKYQDAAGTGLIDYRTERPYGVFSYRLSERSTALTSIGLSRLIRASSEGTARNAYAQALLEHDVTELLKAKVGVGLNRIRSESSAGTDSRTGWLALANLERKFETGTLTLGAAREINPTGSGDLTQTDRLYGAWTQNLSPELSYTLGGAIYRNKPATAASATATDTYYRLNAGIAFLLAEDWALEAEIAHAGQRPAQGETIQANSIFFGTRYSFPTQPYSF